MSDYLFDRHSDSSSDGKERPPTPGEVIEREDDLDEALDESFPASDPPSVVSPHSSWNGRKGNRPRDESSGRGTDSDKDD